MLGELMRHASSTEHHGIIGQRAGALREFLNVLGPEDDITHFEYVKKTYREQGPALVGIELKDKARISYEIDNFPYGMREFAVYDNNGYLLQFGQEII